jgi:hypothetical protein
MRTTIQMNVRAIHRLSLVLVLIVGACSQAVSAIDAGGDSNTNDALATDSALDAVVQCRASPSVFPTFDRSCATAMDCVIAAHQTDCCGTLRAMGIRASEQTAFQAAESACIAMYPACGCASNLITTDDGAMSRNGLSSIQVTCNGAMCTTSVR